MSDAKHQFLMIHCLTLSICFPDTSSSIEYERYLVIVRPSVIMSSIATNPIFEIPWRLSAWLATRVYVINRCSVVLDDFLNYVKDLLRVHEYMQQNSFRINCFQIMSKHKRSIEPV